jgi:hypothetical protein
MTDIVKRLRQEPNECGEEAADEIERLRAALQSLYDNEKWDDDDPRLAAARAQARAALAPGDGNDG